MQNKEKKNKLLREENESNSSRSFRDDGLLYPAKESKIEISEDLIQTISYDSINGEKITEQEKEIRERLKNANGFNLFQNNLGLESRFMKQAPVNTEKKIKRGFHFIYLLLVSGYFLVQAVVLLASNDSYTLRIVSVLLYQWRGSSTLLSFFFLVSAIFLPLCFFHLFFFIYCLIS